MEAMAYGCPSTSAFISIHNMASWMIDRFGSAEVKQKYLPSMITHGADGQLLPDRALVRLRRGGAQDQGGARRRPLCRVSGSKAFISGGGENEVYVTMVRTGEEGPKGISALVIDKDMKGVSFGAQEKKLGWHSQPTAQVNFDEVRVPVANRVGGEGEGFRIAMMGLDGGRLNIGACSLGGAQRCLDEAVKYTKERKQFGTPIADFQATQFTLADMETELQAARYLLYVAAAKVTAERARQDPLRGHGQAPRDRHRLVGRRPRAAASRRLRLSAGLSDRALLARPPRPLDPRRHQPDHAGDRQPRHASAVVMANSKPTLPFDPFALAQAAGETAIGLAARPAELLNVQLEAAKQWSDFWTGAMSGTPSEKPRDRRFSAPEWQDDPYYRAIRDAYLLASKQLRETVGKTAGNGSQGRWPASCSTNI